MKETECCEVWEKYQRCREYHISVGTKQNTEKAYRFFEGDQWHGVKIEDHNLPIYNFINPVVKYKVAMIALNSMVINYSVIGAKNERLNSIAETLNILASRNWERLKMDTKCWEIVKASAIAGDSYIYFYDNNLNCQIIDKTNIFFGDEQQKNIQRQPFIIIAERRPVEDIIHEAKENGLSADETNNIISDDDLEDVVSTENNKSEVRTEKGKCTSLLYLKLEKNGDLKFLRCTKNTVYSPEQIIKDFGCYPIAQLINNHQKGTARGRGEVLPLIDNQIEVNRSLARRAIHSKLNAFPKLVYASDKINNPSELGTVGTAIEVDGGIVDDVKNAITYLTPPRTSSEIENLTKEIMSITRDLAGAGDAALGNVDPTQASGTAIIAVRDQASIPLNEQTAAFRQFVEDIALIWMNTERVYNPENLKLKDGSYVKSEELKNMNLVARIDVSPKNPFSKFAREQALEKMFVGGHISFEEYVAALDDDSSVPKAKLQEIIQKRQPVTVEETELVPTENADTLEQLQAEIDAAKKQYTENDLNEVDRMVREAKSMYGGAV